MGNIFEQIKQSTDFQTVFRHFCGSEIKNNDKTLCPFHDEKTPSFHIYKNAAKCYGCGWRGDTIAFVAELRSLRPYEAARLICQELNISIPGNRAPKKAPRPARLAAQAGTVAEQRAAQAKYRKLKQLAFLALADFRDLSAGIFEAEGLNIEPELADAVHMLPQIEYYLEVLAAGSASDKLELLREGVLERWARLRSYQTLM
ncbi:MAG: hypothetical protein GX881_03235 [Firmicutes bacterium]|nr:hypothetical protein [Bacillota bacterium]